MKFVEPKIFMLAETKLNQYGVKDFLNHLGVPNWSTNETSDAEKLIEMAGKTCYMSFSPDLNRNLTKVRSKQNRDYIQDGIIKSNHGSVLEHASVTFAICNVSRVFTHELVRHRAGCAYSQESGRYVITNEIKAYRPKYLSPKENQKLQEALSQIEIMYKDIEKDVFERIGNDFNSKKQATSALRRMLPNGQTNTIIFTANHRALRHILNMRISEQAEEEIQYVFKEICHILKFHYPSIYEDFKIEEDV